MDLKGFLKDLKLSQSELAELFQCGAPNVSNIVNGKRTLTGLQLRLLIERFGFDIISKYAEPDELPASITINMPKVSTNTGQINGGGGNTMTVDTALIEALKEAQRQNAKSQEQIDRLLAILEKNQ